MRKVLAFAILCLDFAICLICCIILFIPAIMDVLGLNGKWIPLWIVWTVLIIAMIVFAPIGMHYARVKQSEDFDEFGVRKKDAKLRLSSQNREKVEATQLAEMERIISSADLKRATKKGSTHPDKNLDRMIGIAQVKNKVHEMEARMEFESTSKRTIREKRGSDTNHMVFYGSPGTGKTAVARIITGILYDYEYIEKNKIVEIDGNFLKAGNAADTEKKVRIILKKAYGGVLFVDEAYALTQSGDAEGKQAIATLIKEMEDNRDKLVVIFAGYPKEMSDMLDANPGFRSRIKEYIEFPSYSNAELCQIAILMAGDKGFAIDGDSFGNLTERLDNERRSPSWGNARTVRSVIEESIDQHAVNYQKGVIPADARYKIMSEDIKINPSRHI